MRKFLSLSYLFALVMTCALFTSCEKDDYDRAIELSGEWTGYFGTYYTVENPRTHKEEAFVADRTDLAFYPDHDYARYGYGYQVDYFNRGNGPYSKLYYYFKWSINNGTIIMSYPEFPEYSGRIRNYHLTSRRFHGYFEGATEPFDLDKLSNYYYMEDYYHSYHYYHEWYYDDWSWDYYFYAKERNDVNADASEAKAIPSEKLTEKPKILRIGNIYEKN